MKEAKAQEDWEKDAIKFKAKEAATYLSWFLDRLLAYEVNQTKRNVDDFRRVMADCTNKINEALATITRKK